jgi:eukaryotic-like serine/threonine-protein kinase
VIGTTISHYHILAQLGEGGMGVVYRAADLKLDRTVALKFLAPEFVRDTEAKARFVHEAKAASALDHPNICTIHGIEETPDGRLFIAMACYQGETLKDMIARGPLDLATAVAIASQVAQGLAKAHGLGIVHRDIKPANVFVTEDGLVKLLDFGIAKLAGQTQVTRTGAVLGTVHYMSPEQVQGQEVDRRTDLWSLAVILYEMLAGRPPFTGESPQSVAYAIVHGEPPPLAGQREDVPRELDLAITRCLGKTPAERYQGIEAFLQVLQPLAGPGDTRLVPASGPPASTPWPTRAVCNPTRASPPSPSATPSSSTAARRRWRRCGRSCAAAACWRWPARRAWARRRSCGRA